MSTIQLEYRLNLERSILKIELKSVSAGFMADLSHLRFETVTEMDLTRDDLQCYCRMFFGVQDYYNHLAVVHSFHPGLKLMIIFMFTSKMYELLKYC